MSSCNPTIWTNSSRRAGSLPPLLSPEVRAERSTHGGLFAIAVELRLRRSLGPASEEDRRVPRAHRAHLPPRGEPRPAVHPAPVVSPPRRKPGVGGKPSTDDVLDLPQRQGQVLDLIGLARQVRRQPNVLKRAPLLGGHDDRSLGRRRGPDQGERPFIPF
jgi:hypothetical protein